MFHQMPGVSAEDIRSGKCREFTGDGTPHLRVPGLVGDPGAVRVDRIELPTRLKMGFPDNHLNGQIIHSDMQILRVDSDTDGVPVLLRSIVSNDGIWQKGHKVFVWGDWEDLTGDVPKPEEVPPAPKLQATANDGSKFDPAEKLAQAGVPRLTALAKGMGITLPEGITKENLITAILAKKAETENGGQNSGGQGSGDQSNTNQ